MYRRYSRLNADELEAIRQEMATRKPSGQSHADTNVTLYLVRLSPTCRVVWLYLLQNNIPHQLVDADFSNKENAPEFFHRFPHKEVPVLVDGKAIVFEAPAILNYLAQHYTNHTGFGFSPETRCLVESLISWANSDLHRVTGYYYSYPQFLEKYRLSDDNANNVLVEGGLSHMVSLLERIDNNYLSQSKKYLTGDRITVADSFVATVLLQAEWSGFGFSLWPQVTAWLQRVRAQEFWSDVHAEHQKLVSEVQSARYE